jgi:hypothetical protein
MDIPIVPFGTPYPQNVPDAQPILIMDQLSAPHIGQPQPDGSAPTYEGPTLNTANFMEFLVGKKTLGGSH